MVTAPWEDSHQTSWRHHPSADDGGPIVSECSAAAATSAGWAAISLDARHLATPTVAHEVDSISHITTYHSFDQHSALTATCCRFCHQLNSPCPNGFLQPLQGRSRFQAPQLHLWCTLSLARCEVNTMFTVHGEDNVHHGRGLEMLKQYQIRCGSTRTRVSGWVVAIPVQPGAGHWCASALKDGSSSTTLLSRGTSAWCEAQWRRLARQTVGSGYIDR
jgi:hypothetical protein